LVQIAKKNKVLAVTIFPEIRAVNEMLYSSFGVGTAGK
jgi:hypothetical protein